MSSSAYVLRGYDHIVQNSSTFFLLSDYNNISVPLKTLLRLIIYLNSSLLLDADIFITNNA
jgi:hypothetical protein